jgi:hypothetical protein
MNQCFLCLKHPLTYFPPQSGSSCFLHPSFPFQKSLFNIYSYCPYSIPCLRMHLAPIESNPDFLALHANNLLLAPSDCPGTHSGLLVGLGLQKSMKYCSASAHACPLFGHPSPHGLVTECMLQSLAQRQLLTLK